MVFRQIDTGIKTRAVALLEEGFPLDQIAYMLDVSIDSIHRWHQNTLTYDSPNRPQNPLQGRPRALPRHLLESLHLLLIDDADLFIRELCLHLAVEHDINVSETTLRRNLKEYGFTHKRLKKVAAERDEYLRASFVAFIGTHFRPEQLVYMDETSKDERDCYRRNGWSLSGMPAIKMASFWRGQRLSGVGALAIDGWVGMRVFEGSVNTERFLDFLLENVLPNTNPWPGPRSVLVMDNCAIHKAEVIINVIEASGRVVVFLPPYSPDMNPIEGAFARIKAHLAAEGYLYQTMKDPVGVLLDAFGAVSPDIAHGLFRYAGWAV